MAKELSEDTSFNLSIKTLVGIAVGISVLIGFWFQIQNDIDEASRAYPLSGAKVFNPQQQISLGWSN